MSKIIFRFRVTFEDVDDVERIIDVSGANSFNEFHLCIQDAIQFDRIKPASFFKANNNWRTSTEYSTEKKAGAKAADKSLLARSIDDPYQKFIYLYDEQGGNWTLKVEVIKLSKEAAGTIYPSLVKSVGAAPKQYVKPEDIIKDPSAKLFKEADGLIKDLGELMAAAETEEDEEDEEDEKDDFGLYGEEIDESEI